MRIEWTADAVADLKEISEYIEQDRNLKTANRVTRAIYDAVQSLRRLPYRGRFGRLENTRELVIPQMPWIAVYRIVEGRVRILKLCTARSNGRDENLMARQMPPHTAGGYFDNFRWSDLRCNPSSFAACEIFP